MNITSDTNHAVVHLIGYKSYNEKINDSWEEEDSFCLSELMSLKDAPAVADDNDNLSMSSFTIYLDSTVFDGGCDSSLEGDDVTVYEEYTVGELSTESFDIIEEVYCTDDDETSSTDEITICDISDLACNPDTDDIIRKKSDLENEVDIREIKRSSRTKKTQKLMTQKMARRPSLMRVTKRESKRSLIWSKMNGLESSMRSLGQQLDGISI